MKEKNMGLPNKNPSGTPVTSSFHKETLALPPMGYNRPAS